MGFCVDLQALRAFLLLLAYGTYYYSISVDTQYDARFGMQEVVYPQIPPFPECSANFSSLYLEQEWYWAEAEDALPKISRSSLLCYSS